ncbi:hypothetical protein BH09ACT5_BH09ACT5_18650 [soil metagenome]
MTQGNRLWVIGAVTLMVALVVAGWFLGVQPNLTSAASAEVERIGVDAQNDASVALLAELTEKNKKLPSLEDEYAELQKSIPSTTDTSAFINGLDGLALAADVRITGINVSDPQAYTVPVSGQSTATDATAEPTDGSTPAPVATAPPTGSVAITNPLITPENFVGVGISIEVTGRYDAVLSFVHGLQTGERLFLVTGITSNKDPESAENVVTATVSGMVYVLEKG